MDQTSEFIDLFRQLEAALREAAVQEGGSKEFGNLLSAMAKRDTFIQQRWNEIDLCRQIRNILSHFPTIAGRRPLVPDEALIAVLRETVEHIEHPIRAIDAAMKRANLFTASMQSPVREILWQMRKRGFSHVPVMEGEALAAVFSVGTIFTATCREKVPPMDLATIADFMPDIMPDRHENERYVFVSSTEPLNQVKEHFQRPKSRQKVAVVFVTADGGAQSPLQGMITPWDVIKALED